MLHNHPGRSLHACSNHFLMLKNHTGIDFSFYFVQALCLAWVTAVAVLCSSLNILTSSLIQSLFLFGLILENTMWLGLPRPAHSVWVTPMMFLIRRKHSTSWAALMAGRSLHTCLILFLDTPSKWSHWLRPSSSSEVKISHFWLLPPVNNIGTCRLQE